MKVTLHKEFDTAEEAVRFLQGREPVLAIAAEEIDLLKAGRKIEAIKSIRTRTGAGLKESKELCDKLDVLYSPVEVEPSWTAHSGRTTRLRDLPTPYLQSALRFALRMNSLGYGAGCGLANACEDELRRRGA